MLVLNVLYLAIALLQTAAQENCPKLENVTNTRHYDIAGAVPPTAVEVTPYEPGHHLHAAAIHMAMQGAAVEICVHNLSEPYPEGTNYPAENLQVSFYNRNTQCGTLIYRDVCTVATWWMRVTLSLSTGTLPENQFNILVEGSMRGYGTMELISRADEVAVA